MEMYATMCRMGNDETEYAYKYGVIFKTRNMPLLPTSSIDDLLAFGIMRITDKVDEYQSYESDWMFVQVEKIFLEITQFQPPTGGGHMPLPKNLAARQEIINPANKDDKCFQWAILAALHPPIYHAERITYYKKYEKELNFDGIPFPVQADEIILR